jgi:glucose/arabinose dehydrogenase
VFDDDIGGEHVHRKIVGAALALSLGITAVAGATTFPTGFSESLVATLTQPTHFAVAPDGRVFVAEKQGKVRVVKNGVLLSTAVLTVTVDTERYRGIMGLTLDRNFASNGFLYIFYSPTSPNIHNRVSRFTVVGDTASSGSELILLEIPPSTTAAHNGGALMTGADGKLYIGCGDDQVTTNAQSLNTVRGKILRINTDGSIPTDNPFLASTSGINRSIWAIGWRQPWSIGFDYVTGESMMHNVGETSYEEVNIGKAGGNYGHPIVEGPSTDPQYESPLYSYKNGATGTTGGCATIGGAFYRPATVQFPSTYVGRYFFADHCNGWMKTIDPANGNAVSVFATGMVLGDGIGVSDIQVAPDGSLYYVTFSGRLTRVTYNSSATPSPTPTPTPRTTPTPIPTVTPTPQPCHLVTSGQWMNAGFTAQTGTFTYELDATPSSATMGALVGLSNGAAASSQAFVGNIRFRSDGLIEMRDGSLYRSASPLRYFANMQYHVRMVVNVATHTYSVYVKPFGEGEVVLGLNYQLRTAVTSINNFAASVTTTNGTLNVCGRVLTGASPTPTPRPTATPVPTATATPTATPRVTPTATPRVTPTATPAGTYVEVTPGASAVTASTNDGNVPANTVDNNIATRWSGSGDGEWIRYDLGTTRTVGYVTIAFYNGNTRQTHFDVQVSNDGTTWSTVAASLSSSGTTTAVETFDFADAAGRYVRYFGHGNTLNLWNSLTEVEIFALP